MATMQVFVSHAHADNELCDRYVAALRGRGLDVWYDRTNLQVGHSLSTDIEAELRRRTAFVVIATPASLASQWVRSEIAAFRSLAAHDPTRLFLPVRAAECEMPLLWADIRWIDVVSLGFDAAVSAMAMALGAPVGATPTPRVKPALAAVRPTPQPTENVEELVEKGWKLIRQNEEREAIPFLERATQLDPRSSDAWGKLGWAYKWVTRYDDALMATDRALELDEKQAWVWIQKATVLVSLKRYEKALAAYDRAIDLQPSNFEHWHQKYWALLNLKRWREAKEALKRAKELGYKGLA